MSKYKIIVSEPWDFNGESGPNLIVGEVVKVLSPLVVIFKAEQILNFEDRSGTLLLLKSRFKTSILTQADRCEGTVNGGLILTGDYEDKDEVSLEDNSKFMLTGNLMPN